MSVHRSSFIESSAAWARVAVCAAALSSVAAYAAPPITVTSKAPADGPIKYTVKVVSKVFGNVQETRTISSGQADDYNWKTAPPGGAVAVPENCPNRSEMTLDPNGAAMRALSIRLAPDVAADGTATMQMSVQGTAPKGKAAMKAGGKTLQCPQLAILSQIVRFTMPTNGSAKMVGLSDGSKVTVSAQR
jgi:hypothetical protein